MHQIFVFTITMLTTVLSTQVQAACPAPPVGHPADTVIQMKAIGGNSGMGPTSAINATEEGAIIYDDTANIIKVCDGTNWISMAGGGGSGDGAIIDAFADAGHTIDAVTITATNDKWPDYIVCDNGGQPRTLVLDHYRATDVQYIPAAMSDTPKSYIFNKDGTYKSRSQHDTNCGAAGNDIDSICDDGRCGFF